jgi:hypothetical protein
MIVRHTLKGVLLSTDAKNKCKTRGFKQKVWNLRSRSVSLSSRAIKGLSCGLNVQKNKKIKTFKKIT